MYAPTRTLSLSSYYPSCNPRAVALAVTLAVALATTLAQTLVMTLVCQQLRSVLVRRCTWCNPNITLAHYLASLISLASLFLTLSLDNRSVLHGNSILF